MKLKRIAAALLAGCMLAAMSGCSVEEMVSKVGTEVRAGGRDHSKEYTGKDNDVLTNTFFAFNINSSEVLSTVNDYLPDDAAHTFLIVDITVQNVFEDDSSIPMSPADFELSWASLDGTTISPISDDLELTNQLNAEWTQFKGESKTGKLVFLVPNDITEFNLLYKELYEDDFEGSTYTITFTPDRTNYVALTEEEVEMVG